MPRDVPGLIDDDLLRLTEVLITWSEVHPRPDLPLIQLGDGSELTPRDIGVAMAEPGSRIGQFLYRAFSAAQIEDELSPAEPLDEILTDFERDTRAWGGEQLRG
jgi:hypothetical protein